MGYRNGVQEWGTGMGYRNGVQEDNRVNTVKQLSKTTAAQGTFKMWSLLPGGLLIQGQLSGNSIPWSWFPWSSLTGGRLDRFYCITIK